MIREDHESRQDLVKSLSLDNLMGQREAFYEGVDELLDLIKKLDRITAAFVPDKTRGYWRGCAFATWIKTDHSGSLVTTWDDPREQVRKNVDRHIWRYLMHQSGMKTFMDAQAREKWEDELERGKVPEASAENIRQTFARLYDQRGYLFERGVINVFQSLNWDYRTNSPCLFKKKIILTGAVDPSFSVWCHPNFRIENELFDLERCLSILDGRPEPDHRDCQVHAWSDAVSQSPLDQNTWTSEFFGFRWYKKGTLHLTFRRPDLVDKMNQIIGKHFPGDLPERI